MPIYEFACRDCGSEFEKLVRITTASSEVECPTCSSTDIKKKLSTFATKTGRTAGAGSDAACTPGGT